MAELNDNAGWIYGFIFLFLVLIKGMREGSKSNIFYVTPEVCDRSEENHRKTSNLSQGRWCNVVRVEYFYMVKPVVVGFCSIGGSYYCGWYMCHLRILAQFWGSEMRTRGQSKTSVSPRLVQHPPWSSSPKIAKGPKIITAKKLPHLLFLQKSSTVDVQLDSKCASDWKVAINVGCRWTASTWNL